jgi:hypothetical protein
MDPGLVQLFQKVRDAYAIVKTAIERYVDLLNMRMQSPDALQHIINTLQTCHSLIGSELRKNLDHDLHTNLDAQGKAATALIEALQETQEFSRKEEERQEQILSQIATQKDLLHTLLEAQARMMH